MSLDDGVFCNLPFEDFQKLTPQQIAHNVGVQSQTFTVVNDEDYYYPDLFSGMIIDEATGKGTDIAIYTGSTTGTQRDNQICSPFSPITWQVDRKCHLISASSFDMVRQNVFDTIWYYFMIYHLISSGILFILSDVQANVAAGGQHEG